MKIFDWVGTVIIGVPSVVFLIMCGDLGRAAAMFPRLLSITIIALLVLNIVVQMYLNRKSAPLASPEKQSEAEKATAEEAAKQGQWYTIIGSSAIYIGLMYLIGFGVASFFFGVAIPYLSGYRRMKVVVPVALGMAAFLVIVGRLFYIPLPAGIWLSLF